MVGRKWIFKFLQDMGEKSEELSLHRKDNDKKYSPENCIWATKIVQANRTRRNRFIEYN